jgi:hypothetical protein
MRGTTDHAMASDRAKRPEAGGRGPFAKGPSSARGWADHGTGHSVTPRSAIREWSVSTDSALHSYGPKPLVIYLDVLDETGSHAELQLFQLLRQQPAID